MERRRAVAIAAVTAATTVGAVAAIAANFGLLGFGAADASPVGQLNAGQVAHIVETPATAPATDGKVTVRYEDVYVPVPATSTPVNPAPAGVSAQPAQEDSAPQAGPAAVAPASTPSDDNGHRPESEADDHGSRAEPEADD